MLTLIRSTYLIGLNLERMGYSPSIALRVTSNLSDIAHRPVVLLDLLKMMAEGINGGSPSLVFYSLHMLRQSIWDFAQFVKQSKPVQHLITDLGVDVDSVVDRQTISSETEDITAGWLQEYIDAPMWDHQHILPMADWETNLVSLCHELLGGLRGDCLSFLQKISRAPEEAPRTTLVDNLGIIAAVAALTTRDRLDSEDAPTYDGRNLLACLGSMLRSMELESRENDGW